MLRTQRSSESSPSRSSASRSSRAGAKWRGPLIVALAAGASCLVVWLSRSLASVGDRQFVAEGQVTRARRLTCEAAAQFDVEPAGHPARGLPMRIVIPNDGRLLSVRYGVRDAAPGFLWHDCSEPGLDCYPPGNSWFTEFRRTSGPDGQEFQATAWNGSRYSNRVFRILVIYSTTAGECTTVAPVTVRSGTSESLTASVPTAAHVEAVRVEIDGAVTGTGWQPCKWGTDCGPSGPLSLSPLMQTDDRGSASTAYSASVISQGAGRDRSVRMILTYIP
jgi:hypothetical protein